MLHILKFFYDCILIINMTCIIFKLDSHEDLVSCSCGSTIHYMCLHKGDILNFHWTNGKSPKFFIAIFKSTNLDLLVIFV